jgi:tRNA A37 N6-isopentenylltransferase MiaA
MIGADYATQSAAKLRENHMLAIFVARELVVSGNAPHARWRGSARSIGFHRKIAIFRREVSLTAMQQSGVAASRNMAKRACWE